jgi:hypothetical protein
VGWINLVQDRLVAGSSDHENEILALIKDGIS